MQVIDVSVTETGVQVVVESHCRAADLATTVTPASFEWPRMAAAAKQLAQDVPEIVGLRLVRVDRRSIQQQFSFARETP